MTSWAATWGRRDWAASRPAQRLAEAGIESYRSNIRTNVRALWSGAWTVGEFVNAMTVSVERGIMWAWAEGAAACGVGEDEMTEEEQDARTSEMWSQWSYIGGFADAIDADSKANDGKLEPLLSRAELWVNHYNEVVSKAKAMACADTKAIWILGPTESHCVSCAGYAGRVYRYSTWLKWGALPQSYALACRGFNCQCSLEMTDAPANKGHPPAPTYG